MALPHRECIAERAVEVQQATPQFARVAQMADFVLARQGRAAMRALMPHGPRRGPPPLVPSPPSPLLPL